MAGSRLPIAGDGWGFVLVPLGVAAVAGWAGWPVLVTLGLAVSAFMAFFFRDPERDAPALAGAILAPADGKVVDVRGQFRDSFVGAARQVSIFLSPLDVHVNRAPLAGVVADVEYRRGAFRPAYEAQASERNERTSVAIEGDGGRVVVRQIAGILARRIVCRARKGDRLQAGERFGMIKFGSRTDVVMPESADLRVKLGDRVRAGETVLAVLR